MEKLTHRIVQSLCTNSGRTAIDVLHREYTYDEVKERSFLLLSALNGVKNRSGFIGIFGYRSVNTYTGIIAALLSGRGYMPVNPHFPADRVARMINLANCNTIILSEECEELFAGVADKVPPLHVICTGSCETLRERYSMHNFINAGGKMAQEPLISDVSSESSAYLLFTSGSTGIPKGVVVLRKNLISYLDYTFQRYDFNPSDRFTQMFDTTFDLSVHDIFVSLFAGGTLCVVPEKRTMAPAGFIKDKGITVWFSVPSVVMFMSKMGMLKAGAFPSLRYSLFCGEALPMKSVENWQSAASHSRIENLYGPTEATVAITNYRWDKDHSPAQCVNGVVPIGYVFDGQKARVIDDKLKSVAFGGAGELCVSGSQITAGYLNNPEETEKRFVHLDRDSAVWYRTGDLVRETDWGFVYLGRIDEQVQLRGYRVELQEIDRVLRDAVRNDMAAAVPVSLPGSQTVDAVYGYIEGKAGEFDLNEIVNHCKKYLPEYMVPSKLFIIDKLPLNANGKINRKELSTWK